MQLTKGIIRADIIAAKQAIEYFDKKRIKDIKNVAAYHLQQAAEKLIKYQIYQSIGTNVSIKQMHTHDLSKLIEYADAEGIYLVVPEYITAHINSITDWEAGSRYNISFSVRIDSLKKCYEVIDKWLKEV